MKIFAFSAAFSLLGIHVSALPVSRNLATVDAEACLNLTRESVDDGPPFLVLVLLIIISIFGGVTLFYQHKFLSGVPPTLKMFVEGVLLGSLHEWTNQGLGAVSSSIELWVDIDPHLLLALFIPPLIFTDVVKLDLYLLGKSVVQCLILAIPLVLAMIAGLGIFVKFLIPEWSYFLVFTFGATLGATDPVSVVAVLDVIECPAKLKMIIGGESHLGDLTALTVFLIFLDLTTGAETESRSLAGFVLRMMFAGGLIGFLFGSVTVLMIRKNSDKTSSRALLLQLLLTLGVAFATFVFAENYIKSSGITGVVAASIVLAGYSRQYFSNVEIIDRVWQMIEYFASVIIFTLAGLILGKALVANIKIKTFEVRDYAIIPIVYGALMTLRLGLVFSFHKYLNSIGYGVTGREALMISWSGLRGAVNLALAIVVNLEITNKVGGNEGSRFLLIVGGVVFLMLLINASTARFVLSSLGLSNLSQVETEVLKYIRTKFEDSARIVYDRLAEKEEFENHTSGTVINYVSSLNVKHSLDDIPLRSHRHRRSFDQLDLSAEEDKLLLKQLRNLFYSALRASYWDQLKNGALPIRSVVSNILFTSIDVARDGVNKGEPLKDFKYTNLARTKERYNRHLVRIDQVSKYLPVPRFMIELYGKVHVAYIYNGVFLSIIVKEGHKMAQKVLQEFATGVDGSVSDKIDTIIEESQQQIQQAENYLLFAQSEDAKIADSVQTTIIGFKVLEKQRLFVEKLKDQGIINETSRIKLLRGIRADRDKLLTLKTDETFNILHRITAVTVGTEDQGMDMTGSDSDSDSLPPRRADTTDSDLRKPRMSMEI